MTNNSTRTSSEIEREIERERSELTGTLDDLQSRLSVEGVARQVSQHFRDNGGDLARSVSDAVKANPVALALTGVGLAWLMMGQKNGQQAHSAPPRDNLDSRHDTAHHGPDGIGDARVRATTPYSASPRPTSQPSWARPAHDDGHSGDDGKGLGSRLQSGAGQVSDKVSGAASSVGDSASRAGAAISGHTRKAGEAVSSAARSARGSAQDAYRSGSRRAAAVRDRIYEGTEALSKEARARVIAARERALDARDAAYDYTSRGRDKAVDLYEENPLIAGALAVAVGAAIAAALPRTRVEDRYAGEYRDSLFDEAERIYAEEKEKLARVSRAATDEARDIAREVKADADASAPADTASDALVNKAKESGKRVADAAKAEADKQNLGKPTA
ncbi:DUF3618 domain-containing protein [Pseudohoeflea coraliihabitans]|uniref:DUF3618 domain-containing protein n=1 Tax=Pseudohoeflea coraliihabitans TaxID=2860393 RepID=A0ABS6WLP8_9HYPH|nr:DUF3618 domain-containing protein [Pseudohoeflea sp. DP4N28-3]MBW3096342.1 DUF3618 domain-containing protein [Pseudohoeflea sp. DP4N28-3]